MKKYPFARALAALALLSFLLPSAACAARRGSDGVSVQPAFWWSGMKNPSLQLLLRCPGAGDSEVTLEEAEGVRVDSVVRPANREWLLVYLNVAQAAPQRFRIALRQGRRTLRADYELRRRDGAVRAQGFDASDVVYLLMPDRFANGDPSNDVVRGMRESASSRQPDARHGGDLAGMQAALGYLDSLGVTAIWPTPLLENDMPAGSYHGYAITDYYRIDPRFGTNEQYRAFVAEAHRRGLKVIQDMVFNHCGSLNPLFTSMPDTTWFNHGTHYVQTDYRTAAVTDPYAAPSARLRATDGWFVESMPDLNQRNPHVLKYITQNSIWWVEYAGIDGIRQDTYPYADRRAMAAWCRALRAEYPRFNIVGETWIGNNVGVSQWQAGSPLVDSADDPALPTVMDFPLMDLLNSALDETTDDWNSGLSRLQAYLAQDAVYADPTHLLTFLSNHDTPRFARTPAQAACAWRYRQALVLLLTLRGIPQLYSGDELAMSADKSRGDGWLRQDFPGFLPTDSVNAFCACGLSDLQRATLDLTRRLLRWRRGNEAVARGTLTHYAVQDGVYVYSRRAAGRTVTVLVNGTDRPACVPLDRYAESLPSARPLDVLTGRPADLSSGCLQLGVRGVALLDFVP